MRLFLIIVVALGMVDSVVAASATFSKDSRHVYLLACGTSQLLEIDLKQKSCRVIDFSASLKGASIKAISCSSGEGLLCATESSIWSCDPQKIRCTKICDAPNGIALSDIACNPLSEQVLALGNDDKNVSGYAADNSRLIYCLRKDGNHFEKVFARYGTAIGNPVFSADGTLFFQQSGDLWMGFIQNDDDWMDKPRLDLIAYRYAPFAQLCEQEGTSSSTGLGEIAVTQHWVYSRYARMGGSGWGSLIRFHRPLQSSPQTGARKILYPGEKNWKILALLCDSVEKLTDEPCHYLCSSWDQNQVLFANPSDIPSGAVATIFLIQNDGKPEKVEIKGLADDLKAPFL